MSPYAISTSGLLAQGARVNAIARNIANINTPNHVPVDIVTLSAPAGGVETAPVSKPEDSLENQLVNLISAEHNYKANAKVIETRQDMDDALLDIFT